MNDHRTPGILQEFDIEAELGRGGMGIVYRARERSGGRIVALKVLPRRLAQNPSNRKRFASEARAILNLKHPNIVEAYKAAEIEGTYYISMEYVDGQTVAQHIASRGRYSVRQSLDIAQQAASALAYAHAQGVIHRDIKPHNIMVNSKGRVKVMDFGVAKLTWNFELSNPVSADQAGSAQTTMGGSLGTLMYMSPEQIRGDPLDPRTDIYSLGVTLYEMLTGEPPFAAGESAGLMYQITREGLPNLRERNPEVPEAAARLAFHMVARNVGLRPRTCSEVSNGIGGIVAEFSRGTRWARRIRSAAESAESAMASGLKRFGAVLQSRWFLRGLAAVAILAIAVPLAARRPVTPKTRVIDLGEDLHIEMVWIPPGTFMMGSFVSEDEDVTPHKVSLTRGFWLGKYEVTRAQWRAMVDDLTSPPAPRFRISLPFLREPPPRPMDGVSWEGCQEFMNHLNEKTGVQFRLPTEAEWEYACRAGSRGDYCFGNDIGQLTAYGCAENSNLSAVGQKKPNAWGLYDMHGNVYEWCQDWYGEYPSEAVWDPTGPATGDGHVLRGGAFFEKPELCRSDARMYAPGTHINKTFGGVGLRLASDWLPSDN